MKCTWGVASSCACSIYVCNHQNMLMSIQIDRCWKLSKRVPRPVVTERLEHILPESP